ncbi:hypothetical protein [Streptomyces sp. NPDC002588]
MSNTTEAEDSKGDIRLVCKDVGCAPESDTNVIHVKSPAFGTPPG